MRSVVTLLFLLLVCASCSEKKEKKAPPCPEAKLIYSSPAAPDLRFFVPLRKNLENGTTEFRYICDTALRTDVYYADSTHIRGWAHYYKGKEEGIWILRDPFTGKRTGKGTYANGKLNGMLETYYPDGSLKVKTFCINDTPQYSVRYAEDGKVIDSVTNK